LIVTIRLRVLRLFVQRRRVPRFDPVPTLLS
jgi:hypothetical protein